MHEPPDEDALRAALRERYGLDAARIARLALGRDIAAAVYRVEAAGGALYFLKVRAGRPNTPALVVPGHLRRHGVDAAVAPLPTTGAGLWSAAGDHALILYPFVAEATAMERGLSPEQWIALGAVLRRIHDVAVPAELAAVLPREPFVPDGMATVRRLHRRGPRRAPGDAAEEGLAAIWRDRRPEVEALLTRAGDLGRRLAARTSQGVLCHADFHTNNVLVDAAGRLWVVDWEDAMLAPRERDLMFVLGGGLNRARTGPEQERLFLRGYGPVAADPCALAYYRCARAVSDMAYTAAQVALRADLPGATRQAALEAFTRLFLPGSIVEIALTSPA